MITQNMRRRFTKWYVRKGYVFLSTDEGETYLCPWYLRSIAPLLISPRVYTIEIINDAARALARAIAEMQKGGT